MQFPERELAILQLAEDMARGLTEHPDQFPSPTVAPEAIREALSAYHAGREQRQEGRVRLQAGAAAKKKALEHLKFLLRYSVKYAQCVSADNSGRLRLVGWGPRRRPTKQVLELPGQPGPLSAEEGPNWVRLLWSAPADGGEVVYYNVERRYRERGDWVHVGGTFETTLRLKDQETRVELEYRVYAMNGTGTGPVTNVVRVVL